MPAKDARIRPVAFLKLSSNMSVNVITHLFSPPFLFLFDNDISLSMGINNTIYRYYSHISGEAFGAREIWLVGLFLLCSVQHDGDSHASVDGKRDGAQCGIAACVLIVRTNSCIAWVRVFLNGQPISSLNAIVSHNDTARTRKLNRPGEVLRVGIFIGIDKNQVEWSLFGADPGGLSDADCDVLSNHLPPISKREMEDARSEAALPGWETTSTHSSP